MSRCVLCELAGSDLVEVKTSNQYIIDNIGEVSVDEICRQVCEHMADIEEITSEQVKEHITEHLLDQKVVLNNMIRELVSMNKVIKQTSVSTCEESGGPIVDCKAIQTYLKTCETIGKLYSLQNTQAHRKQNAT